MNDERRGSYSLGYDSINTDGQAVFIKENENTVKLKNIELVNLLSGRVEILDDNFLFVKTMWQQVICLPYIFMYLYHHINSSFHDLFPV